MGKKISFILLMLAVIFLGDRFWSQLLQIVVGKSQFRYSRLYNGKAAADILIAGNSRGLNFYQPYMEELTHKKTFNISYNGLPGGLAMLLCRDYIEKYPKIKKIIIEISMLGIPDDKLIPAFMTYMPYSERLDTFIHKNVKSSWNAGQVFHLYRFNNEVFHRAFYYQRSPDDDWFTDRTIPQYLIDNAARRKIDLTFNDKELEALGDFEKYCQQKNIDVVYVICPFLPGYKVNHLDSMKQLVEKFIGKKVLDYSNLLTTSSSFGDYMHINLQGSRQLIDRMVIDGALSFTSPPAPLPEEKGAAR